MKVLRYNGCIKLPDDFDGGLSDALRYLADYHEQRFKEGKSKFGEQKDDNLTENSTHNEVTTHWWNIIHDGSGDIHIAMVNIMKSSETDETVFENMPLNKNIKKGCLQS